MDKAKTKRRDIHFYSEKNGKVICVHSAAQRAYAKELEADGTVLSYEACVELDKERYIYVNPIDIRKGYFETDWATDFLVRFADGREAVRELSSMESLGKRADLEKLEFSRRYWASQSVAGWKVVLMEKGEQAYVL